MKSSLLALALFLSLFAFASKPSLAARHEPSLLHSDGNDEYLISEIREFVEDGLDLVMSKSKCPNQSTWPGLVGKKATVAAAFIKLQNPCLNVYLCPASGGPCFRRDRRYDRVRVWVNDEGKVDEVPRIG